MRDADVATDAVYTVNGVIARRELLGDRVRPSRRDARRVPRVTAAAEQILLGRDGQSTRLEHEAAGEVRLHAHRRRARGARNRPLDDLEAALRENLSRPLQAAVAGGRNDDPIAVARQLGQEGGELAGAPRRRPPARDAQVEALGELGQLDAPAIGEGLVEIS